MGMFFFFFLLSRWGMGSVIIRTWLKLTITSAYWLLKKKKKILLSSVLFIKFNQQRRVATMWMCIKASVHSVSVDIINWNCWLPLICLCRSAFHLLVTPCVGKQFQCFNWAQWAAFDSWHTQCTINKHRMGQLYTKNWLYQNQSNLNLFE